jgi:hypothetical protein
VVLPSTRGSDDVLGSILLVIFVHRYQEDPLYTSVARSAEQNSGRVIVFAWSDSKQLDSFQVVRAAADSFQVVRAAADSECEAMTGLHENRHSTPSVVFPAVVVSYTQY